MKGLPLFIQIFEGYSIDGLHKVTRLFCFVVLLFVCSFVFLLGISFLKDLYQECLLLFCLLYFIVLYIRIDLQNNSTVVFALSYPAMQFLLSCSFSEISGLKM